MASMKIETILSLGLAAVGILMTAAIGYTGFQISRVSDLANEIHNTNGRIDSIYPLMVHTAGDIGSIKGTLEVSASKIASAAEKALTASDRADAVARELGAIALRQDEQVKSIRDVSDSVSKLLNDSRAQQDEISNIDRYIKSISASPPEKKTNFMTGAYVFTAKNDDSNINSLKSLGIADLVISQFNDPLFLEKLAQAQKNKKIDMKDFYLITKEEASAQALMAVWKQ